jgi:tRNA-2-methylthio-N6-dimethylallyladenosine synthase
VALSTDLIVGFPGETEIDFRATLDLLRQVRFAQVYAFAYSPRPGTAAAAGADSVPRHVKSRRLTELFALQDAIAHEENVRLVGTTLPVLFDGPSRRDPEVAAGRTPCNRVVNVPGLAPEQVTGKVLQIRVHEAGSHSLLGQPLAAPIAS